MPKKSEDTNGSVDVSFEYFMTDDAVLPGDKLAPIQPITFSPPATKSKKTKSVKAKATDPVIDMQIQGNTQMSYANSYNETNNVLRTAIGQADTLLSEVKEDIDTIRASKTLKSKYTYLTNLTASAATLIQTRITAAREINNSITQSHNLELKRAKDLKEFEQNDKNDDARMMDMYNAFINAPVGMYNNGLNMPTIPDMLLGTNGDNPNVNGVSMNAEHDHNMTPEQLRMRMEANANIEEVVKYDPASGQRWFEVINKETGATVPNYPTSDSFLLEDISIDIRAGIAKNRNLDKVWPLVQIGQTNEY